jgi:hypothetical protein
MVQKLWAACSSEVSLKMSSIPPPIKATEAKELLHLNRNTEISKPVG